MPTKKMNNRKYVFANIILSAFWYLFARPSTCPIWSCQMAVNAFFICCEYYCNTVFEK